MTQETIESADNSANIEIDIDTFISRLNLRAISQYGFIAVSLDDAKALSHCYITLPNDTIDKYFTKEAILAFERIMEVVMRFSISEE